MCIHESYKLSAQSNFVLETISWSHSLRNHSNYIQEFLWNGTEANISRSLNTASELQQNSSELIQMTWSKPGNLWMMLPIRQSLRGREAKFVINVVVKRAREVASGHHDHLLGSSRLLELPVLLKVSSSILRRVKETRLLLSYFGNGQ